MVEQTKLSVILHADVVGSTSLVQKDESLAHERIRETFSNFSQLISVRGGIALEVRGDAVVAEFARASDAANAAISFQAENRNRNALFEDDIRPDLRIGIAIAEVIVADNTVTGAGVVLAQRLEQLAEPGGVCISAAVREALPSRLPFRFESLGERALKGFEEPVKVYRVYAADELPARIVEHQRVQESPTPRPTEPSLSGASGPMVAVLPFRNMSAEPDQDFFADGVSEDIIQVLSASRSFPVLARSATFAYRATDAQAAGRELGAKYVVSGSVRRAGNKIRVSVELADTQTGVQLWSERFDRGLEDLFEVQDEITTLVASIVQPEIDVREMQRSFRAPPDNMNVYERTQKGFWHLWQNDRASYASSEREFERALNLDNTYSRAYGGLAQGKYSAARRLWEDRTSTFQKAIEFARSALLYDDKNPIALRYWGGALSQLGRLDEAMHPLREAIAVWPSCATAYSALAWALALNGEFEDALTAEETTERLRPRDPNVHVCMMSGAVAKYALGDYKEAEAVSRQSININEDFWLSNLMLIAALGQQGRGAESDAARKKLAHLLPGLTKDRLAELMPFRASEHLEHIIDGLLQVRMQLT